MDFFTNKQVGGSSSLQARATTQLEVRPPGHSRASSFLLAKCFSRDYVDSLNLLEFIFPGLSRNSLTFMDGQQVTLNFLASFLRK